MVGFEDFGTGPTIPGSQIPGVGTPTPTTIPASTGGIGAKILSTAQNITTANNPANNNAGLWTGYIPSEPVGKSLRELNAYYKDVEKRIIGVKEIGFRYVLNNGDDTSLTQVILDTTSRADSVRTLHRNETGAAVVLREYSIFGKPIYITTKDAYINDQYNDIQDQNKNGIVPLEIWNDFIVTKEQVDKIAEYNFRKYLTKKHIYVVEMVGDYSFLEPGEHYNLQVGTAGTPEVQDVECELYDMQIELTPNTIGITRLILREVQENIVFSSSVLTRYKATGNISRDLKRTNALIVGSKTYHGTADLYCDGTSDEDEINQAITLIATGFGGGEVILTKGTYYIDGSIDLASNVILRGEGANTIIEKNCNDYAIDITGGSGAEKQNIIIKDLKITRNSADTNSKSLLYATYNISLQLTNIVIYDSYKDAIQISNSDNIYISEAEIYDNGQSGVYMDTTSNIVIYNSVIYDNNTDGSGIRITGTGSGQNNLNIVSCDIYNNGVSGGAVRTNIIISLMINVNILSCKVHDGVSYGLYIGGVSTDLAITDSAFYDNAKSGVDSSVVRSIINNNNVYGNGTTGIRTSGGKNVITGNTVYNNTTTGILVASPDNLVTGNYIEGNGTYGISISGIGDVRNIINGNRSTGNTTANYIDNSLGGTTVLANNEFT